MQIITHNKRLPKHVLKVIAILGWTCVIYMSWFMFMESLERADFAIQAIKGQIPDIHPFEDRYTANPWETLAHTASGIIFAVLGPLQFVGPLRRRFPKVHRISGRIFLPVAIVNGIAAFVMSLTFPMWGSTTNMALSLFYCALMVLCFVYAFWLVMQRQFARHREWMMRGFALGLSVAVFRLGLNDILPALGFEDFNQRWDIVVAVSFPLLLLIAEVWIRATRPARSGLNKKAAKVEPGANHAGG